MLYLYKSVQFCIKLLTKTFYIKKEIQRITYSLIDLNTKKVYNKYGKT